MKVDIATDRLEGELVVQGDAKSFNTFSDRNSGTRDAGLTDSGKTVESLVGPEENRFRLTAVESEAVVAEPIMECRETCFACSKWKGDNGVK